MDVLSLQAFERLRVAWLRGEGGEENDDEQITLPHRCKTRLEQYKVASPLFALVPLLDAPSAGQTLITASPFALTAGVNLCLSPTRALGNSPRGLHRSSQV